MSTQPSRSFAWRIRIVLLVVLVSSTVVIARLVDLQISQASVYKAAAVDNSDYVQTVPATRGVFLDRYHQPLVRNISRYWMTLDENTLFSQEELVPETEALAIIATQSSRVRKEFTRWYPNGDAGAHVLGYVGPISKEELLAQSAATITDLVGRTGLEKHYNQTLVGTAGEVELERTATGKTIRKLREVAMVPGEVIQTTIDPYITKIGQEALAGLTGAVVVEDAQTGGLLAVVSSPSYDPNIFTQFTDSNDEKNTQRRQINSALHDPKQVLFDRAIAGTYPPGSIFKLVTAIAGLESNSITQDTLVTDEGILQVGEYGYANWYFSQYGQTEGDISLQRAIARSNDIYFYKAAEFTGPDTLAQWARTLGFDEKTGIELPGEASGLIPDPGWKEQTLHEQWYLGNTYHFGIGQGDVLVTPVQISQLVQTVANQGVRCIPHLTEKTTSNCYSLGILEEHLKPVIAGMIDACSTGGTAFPFFPHNEQYERTADSYQSVLAGLAACKTGTAEYGPADERGFRKTHAWFTVAFGVPKQPSVEEPGADSVRRTWLESIQSEPLPKLITITVLVESDEVNPYREGSADAGPIALRIMEQIQANVAKESSEIAE